MNVMFSTSNVEAEQLSRQSFRNNALKEVEISFITYPSVVFIRDFDVCVSLMIRKIGAIRCRPFIVFVRRNFFTGRQT